jgi:hypothetical protein
MKNKYDTSVIFLYATGNEAILPKEFRRKIPYTTISTWRKTDYSSYIGNEFRSIFNDALENLELSCRYHEIKKIMTATVRSWLTLSQILQPVLKNKCGDRNVQKLILKE